MPRIRWASSSDAAPVTLRSVQLVAFSASLPLSSLFFLACEDSREGVAGQSRVLPPHVIHHTRTASATAVALSCQACSWPPSRSALRRAQSCTNSTATDSAHTPSRAAAISARDGLGTATWGEEGWVSHVTVDSFFARAPRGRLKTPVRRRSMHCDTCRLQQRGDRGRRRAGRPPPGADSSKPLTCGSGQGGSRSRDAPA